MPGTALTLLTLVAVLALAAPATAGAPVRDLYVSLGDSWAIGVQPTCGS